MPTILIVDDDRHTRRLFESVLSKDARVARFAPKIVQAGDGEEGLVALAEHHPDVVITDLLMPRMDGFTFCDSMRKSDHGRDVGLIVVSGVYRDASIGARIRDEYDGVFYTKPYQIKDVVGTVERLLAPRVGAGAVPAAAPEPPAPVEAMEGTFADRPLPRLLLELYELRATGMLQLRRGRIEKRIDLVVGHPVAVSSNQRHETLGHFLVGKGVITAEAHDAALERAHDEGEKLGEALLELGVLTSAELVKHLTSQARFKIANALRWPDGVWSYRPNRDLADRAKGNALDPVVVVLLGLRRTVDLEAAARKLAALPVRGLAITARGERLASSIARVFGQRLLDAIRGTPHLDALCGGRYEPAEIVPFLDALLVTGCAETVDAKGGRATSQPGATRFHVADPTALDELSGAARALQEFVENPLPAAEPPAPRPRSTTQNLYDQLFGEESHVDEVPIETAGDAVPNAPLAGLDSSVIDVGTFASVIEIDALPPPDAADTARAREDLLEEYLRIQGKDWYSVLEIDGDATPDEVEQSYAAHVATFALETFSGFDLGRDYAKLEEVHAAYRRALEVLGNAALRAGYDDQLASIGAQPQAGLRAELSFRDGERQLEAGDLEGAVGRYREAISRAPDVADYHAGLGWALHLRSQLAGTADPEGDDREAMAQLAQALGIDSDHAAAHEYTGRALAASGREPKRALEHLERALDMRPPRLEALVPLEDLRTRRGEFIELERRYRKLLLAVGNDDRGTALRIWLALGEVYRARLGDLEAARTAFQCALRLAPNDPSVLDSLAQINAGDPSRFDDLAEALRGRWRVEPSNPAPAVELYAAALAAGRHDAAHLVAGALVARGAADTDVTTAYQRFRPRFLLRAQRRLDVGVWPDVRHVEDDTEVGDLFALLDPIAHAWQPMSLAELDVSESDAIPEANLDPAFTAVRDYVAAMLSVPTPRVYRRADFGVQVHVGATPVPVLLAGPAALESKDKISLAFALGRAMTYLWPGRAVGGSRPSRVLKTLLTAAIRFAMPQLELDDPDGSLARVAELIASAPAETGQRVRDLVLGFTRDRSTVNLSRWARALARSANRAGLLLCGDIVVAAAASAASGAEDAVDDLLDYAISPEHLEARAALALSIEV